MTSEVIPYRGRKRWSAVLQTIGNKEKLKRDKWEWEMDRKRVPEMKLTDGKGKEREYDWDNLKGARV